MSELAHAMRSLGASYPTCVQRIDYPVHKGQPNPAHGKFFFVGSIPAACYDHDRCQSKHYDTEADAIAAAIAGGATRIQRCDCSFVEGVTAKVLAEAKP